MATLRWTEVSGTASDGKTLHALVNTMELARTIADIWAGKGVTNIKITKHPARIALRSRIEHPTGATPPCHNPSSIC